MLKTSVIVIGDEILLGRVTDTNSGAIARAMDLAGNKVISVRTVGDCADHIRRAVEDSLRSSDVVFTTGGLGPTKDDITKRILADIFGGETVRDSDVTENIRLLFARRGLELNSLTLDQALVPSSARIIQNRLGTAPIMVFEKDGKMLVAMPGVPFETEGMLPEVVDYIVSRHPSATRTSRHATRIVTGVSESALAQCLDGFERSLPQTYKLAYLPDSPVIKLRLDCYGDISDFDSHLRDLDAALRAVQGLVVLGEGEKSLAGLVIERLRALGYSLATAESCTGGNIAHLITAVPGASDVFNGSVVSYANSAKTNVLNVGKETLLNYGAVSRQVVVQMVEGASRIMETDCAVATSGIAGPGGGTDEKPVGTVWIAVKTPAGLSARCYRFPGTRDRVIARATATALITLLEALS